jgi:hypothetical protein
MKPNTLVHQLVVVSIFSVAMGFLESAVVVYLREIYYPDGFNFPLAPIDNHIAISEIWREAATIIMLLGIGLLAARSFTARFAWFIYSFAVWDIFYYLFLKVLINWPESLMTDDILFLIPVTWVGPVITPLIVSLSMILLAMLLLIYESKNIEVKIKTKEWWAFIAGSLLLITAFTWDYSKYIINNYSFSGIWTKTGKDELFVIASNYIPQSFNWFLFIFALIIILSGIAFLWNRLHKAVKAKR